MFVDAIDYAREHLTALDYALITLAVVALFILLRSGRKAVEERWNRIGAQVSNTLVNTTRDLPAVLDASQQGKMNELRQEIERLTALREQRDWVKIGIVVRGYTPMNGPARCTAPIFAPVLLNVKTGELAPAPTEDGTHPRMAHSTEWWALYNRGHVKCPQLFAPHWHPVEGTDQQIVLLGAVYQYG